MQTGDYKQVRQIHPLCKEEIRKKLFASVMLSRIGAAFRYFFYGKNFLRAILAGLNTSPPWQRDPTRKKEHFKKISSGCRAADDRSCAPCSSKTLLG